MIEENEEDCRNNNICRFCENGILSDKVRDHCHLTGNYRGPAHSKYNINVTQKKSNFILFLFHNFSNHERHMFFKKLVDKKNDKMKIDILPKGNEDHISVINGCIRFIDSYRLLSISLHSLVKTLVDNGHKTLKLLEKKILDNGEAIYNVNGVKIIIEEDKLKNDSIKYLKQCHLEAIEKLDGFLPVFIGEKDLKNLETEFLDTKWQFLTKKIAYPYEYFIIFDDYQKLVNNLKKEEFFGKLKNGYPGDKEKERTKAVIKLFNIKNEENLT